MLSSHINESGTPRMVNVGGKSTTTRRAVAEGRVRMPVSIEDIDRGREWWTPKGPVFQTAVVAGIQGAKATATTVPLCHPLPLSGCDVTVEPARSGGESAAAGRPERSGGESAAPGTPAHSREQSAAPESPAQSGEQSAAPGTPAHSRQHSAAFEAPAQFSELIVRCVVETDAQTGVEMEALCGVSAACLTIYDMGKSVTHGIVIGPIELVEKTGGKHDWHRGT